MASFKKFEDIEAWQFVRQITPQLFGLNLKTSLKNDYKLWDQIHGSSGSIMDSIAEVFERGSNKEFIQFLFFAKGSCGELRSQLYRMKDRIYIDEITFNSLYERLVEIRKKINGLISYLTNSERKGFRFNEPDEQYGEE